MIATSGGSVPMTGTVPPRTAITKVVRLRDGPTCTAGDPAGTGHEEREALPGQVGGHPRESLPTRKLRVRWRDTQVAERVVPRDIGQYGRVEVQRPQRRPGLVLPRDGREVGADQQPVRPEQLDQVAQRPAVEDQRVVVET